MQSDARGGQRRRRRLPLQPRADLSDGIAGRGAGQRTVVRQKRQNGGPQSEQRLARGQSARFAFRHRARTTQPVHFPPQFESIARRRAVCPNGGVRNRERPRQAAASRAIGEGSKGLTSSKIRGIGTTGLFSVYARCRRAGNSPRETSGSPGRKSYVFRGSLSGTTDGMWDRQSRRSVLPIRRARSLMRKNPIATACRTARWRDALPALLVLWFAKGPRRQAPACWK